MRLFLSASSLLVRYLLTQRPARHYAVEAHSRSRPRRPASRPALQFPPLPPSFRGRTTELRTLRAILRAQHPTALALVGGGGSGKSSLACVLGHRERRAFRGRLVWVRIGAWDSTTALQMMAVQLGLSASGDPTAAGRRARAGGPPCAGLHTPEDAATTATTLEALRGLPVTWVITARRCLLGGVTIFPVVPPLVALQKSPFPAVASLTRLLRWHPVALDLADALVTGGSCSARELERSLLARRIGRIAPLDHEDDVPEVRGVVAEALRFLPPTARRMLAVLAHMRGDHMDRASLAELARAGRRARSALEALLRSRLLQEPSAGRYALHATTRHALLQTLAFDEDAIALHYLHLLERRPERLLAEQTHLFALMDWAQERRDLGAILRVQTLAGLFEAGG